MEALFNNSTLFIFFFAMLSIFNYTDLKIEQRVSIIYVSVYAMVALDIIGLKLAFAFLLLTMFCYLEIFTNDAMKLKLLVNPIYKIVDCIYLSVSQYYLLLVLVAVSCFYYKFDHWLGSYAVYLKLVSLIPFSYAIISVLRQKYVINTFQKMYYIFTEFPIHQVEFNDKLATACDILVSIEDRGYFERDAYSILSPSYLFSIVRRKLRNRTFTERWHQGTTFISNILTFKRGYSTIPMQLVRTLGIKYGYNCRIRRKIYEILYSRMFFGGMKRLLNEEHVAKREHFKEYLLYIYFHVVKTYLGDATFSKFLNAFDMQYQKKNNIDIYDCSNEGIFIACMGLNKRASKICDENIDYYLQSIPTYLDRQKVLDMVNTMMDKPYNGNYLA